MNGPENNGPSPEDIGEVSGGGTEPEQSTVETEAGNDSPPPTEPTPTSSEAQEPQPKRGWKERLNEKISNFKENRREKNERRETAKNLARARERRIKGYVEILKSGASTPQQLKDMMAEISFKDLIEAQNRIKYGKGAVGKLRAFMAGESDFQINDDEQVTNYYQSLNQLRQELGREPSKQEHAERLGINPEQLGEIHLIEDANVLKEAGRRLISTFANKRTAVSAGLYLTMGLLTGGFGWAAGGVLMGGMAGRGAAEMSQLFSGKIRDARENVLYAEKARWERMQALSLEMRAQNEDAVAQGALAKELIDLTYRQGNDVLVRNLGESEKELSSREEKFNKLRNRLQTAGEFVGAAAGVTSILNGGVEHLDMDFFNKLDDQSIFHGVQQSDSGWQFLYSSGAEAGLAHNAGATILGAGQFGAHALEATTSQVLAYTIAERTLPMLIASRMAAGDNLETGKKLMIAMGVNKLDPDRYYTKPDPSGQQKIYTREEDGSYKVWEWVEKEEKSGDKSKKVRKLEGKEVEEDKVPAKFKERFIDQTERQRSNNAERLTDQMSRYIKETADENHNPIPENPRGFTYDWNEQPKSIDDIDTAKIDRWYQFGKVNGVDQPRIDPKTGRIVEVGVVGVDVLNNRIAFIRFEKAVNNAEHSPVEITRLDQFLKGFHLHLNPKAGEPFEIVGGNQESGGPPPGDPPTSPDKPINNSSPEKKPEPSPDSKESQTIEIDQPVHRDAEAYQLAEDLNQRNLNKLEDQAEASSKGKPIASHEVDEIAKLRNRIRLEKRDDKNEPKLKASTETSGHLMELINSLNAIEKSNPKLIENTGIRFYYPYSEGNSGERTYTITTVNEKGQTEVANIPIKDGKIDLLRTKLSRINPKGKDRDNLHLLNPKQVDVEKYINSIIDRIEAASDTPGSEVQLNENADGNKPKENKPEEEKVELNSGDNFTLNESFRTDQNDRAKEVRKYLADSFFGDVDENKRSKKLFESELNVVEAVKDEEDRQMVELRVKRNGGYSEETALIYLSDLEGIVSKT